MPYIAYSINCCAVKKSAVFRGGIFMRYGQSRIELTDEERREAKAVLRDNLVSLRKNLFLSQTEFGNRTGISRIRLSMIECGKYEMTWSQFTSILLIFLTNRSTNHIILKSKMFNEKLYLYLQCKREGEELDTNFKLL